MGKSILRSVTRDIQCRDTVTSMERSEFLKVLLDKYSNIANRLRHQKEKDDEGGSTKADS